MKIPSLSLPAAVALFALAAAPPVDAQKLWNTNDGAWGDEASWTPGGVPSGDGVLFAVHDDSPAASVNVNITGAASINQLWIDFGKTVNLNFASGSSLSTVSGLWQLNTTRARPNTPAAPVHLRLNGPSSGTATVHAYGFQTGLGGAAADGSSITFDGPGLTVTNATGGNAAVIGRASAHNLLAVQNGADVTLHGLWLGNSTSANLGHLGNRSVIENASLTLNGGSGNNGLYIGAVRSGGGSSDYQSGMQLNSLHLRNQGSLTLSTGNGGTAAGAVRIGSTGNAHSNSLLIDSGAEFSVISGNSILIGDTSGVNLGGNSLTLSGGTLRTNGVIHIGDFNASGANDGRNVMTVESGGVLYSSRSVTVHGELQLKEGGMIDGRNLEGNDSPLALEIEARGVFQAEGNGLGSNVTTTVKGGTVAIGSGSTAGRLNLRSGLSFTSSPGALAFRLFDSGVSDSIWIEEQGALTLNETLLLLALEEGTPTYGDSWTLFEGEVGQIFGSFDLTQLPTLAEGLMWNTADMNAQGQWRLSVIPEPGFNAMAALGGLVALFSMRLKNRGKVNALL